MADETTRAQKAAAEALVPRFVFERLLNQDQAGRRVVLLGTIDNQPAVLLIERAAFSTRPLDLAALSRSLSSLRNLGANDIYSWFLASAAPGPSHASPAASSPDDPSSSSTDDGPPPDLKLNLIYPSTPAHVAKYSSQAVRLVTETPAIYRSHVRPFMAAKRAQGRLNWVYNILDGKTEQEDVILRTHATRPVPGPSAPADTGGENQGEEAAEAADEGFLLLPDLNWDRTTLTSLHLLAVPTRRDIWSLRDLAPAHGPWLRRMRAAVLAAAEQLYPALGGPGRLKLYVHYQPTYYHFHVHVVHVALEAGATQAVGKAWSLDLLIELVGCGVRLDEIELRYTLGEAGELWEGVFAGLDAEGERQGVGEGEVVAGEV